METNTKFKLLFKNPNSKNYVEIFQYNGKKFKVCVSHRSGSPIGFNSNCSLYIMKDDGSFSGIADNKTIGCKYKNLYVCDDNDIKLIQMNNSCVSAFKDFVKSVYA